MVIKSIGRALIDGFKFIFIALAPYGRISKDFTFSKFCFPCENIKTVS